MSNILIAILALGWQAETPAESKSANNPTQVVDERLDFMRKVIEEIKVKPVDSDSKLSLKFNAEPIFRFGDSARDTADGTLWKIGTGRPLAIVGLEFQQIKGKPHLGYEFLCLTSERFELQLGRFDKTWTPSRSALEFKPLKDARPPGESTAVRLRQMKQIARRFTAVERRQGEEYTLRLLPQPIDQYVIDERRKNHQGTIFVLAYGTNPEVLLFIEPTEDGWQYGLGRVSGADTEVSLDDQVVWNQLALFKIGRTWQLEYVCGADPTELPQPKPKK